MPLDACRGIGQAGMMLKVAAESAAALEAENRALRAALAEEKGRGMARREAAAGACRSLAAAAATLSARLRDGATKAELQAALAGLQTQAEGLGAFIAKPFRAGASLEDEAAPRDGAEHRRLILGSATEYAILTVDLAGCISSWNTGAQRIFGFEAAEILGRPAELLFTPEDRTARMPELGMCLALEQGSAEIGRWHLRKDGSRFWAEGAKMPLRDAEGRLRGFLRILRDRTETHAEEERQSLLLRETNHRIKNTLAVVHSLAMQTERSAETPAEFRQAFGERLLALARAHDMLARSGWDGAPLRAVVERTLEPHIAGRRAGRAIIEGPPVRLPPNAAVTVHLAFHELATNAAKHGSLSVPGGRVEVVWSLERATRHHPPVAEILWRERGGPPAHPPSRCGFGLQLLRRGLAREFGAEVGLDFAPEGAECRIRLALGPPAAARPGNP